MQLSTIWTLPGMTLKERLSRTAEWASMKAAWALPQRVLYWAAVRVAVSVEPSCDPSDVTVKQMMDHIGHGA